MQAPMHVDAAEKQLPDASAPSAADAGLTEVPVKFVVLRRGVVVERRRTRLVSPTFDDVKRCARQWACGDFKVQYVDDDKDLVTMDVEEEWAECVSLWCQQAAQAGSGACPALCLVVELSPGSPAAAPPQHPPAGWWGVPPPPSQHRAWGQGAQQQQPCCRRSANHPGSHARWCSNATGEAAAPAAGHHTRGWRGWGRPQEPAQASVAEAEAEPKRCAAKGCAYAATGLQETHCYRRCAKDGTHGPRCQRRAAAQASASRAAVSSSSDEEGAQQHTGQRCSGCPNQVTGVHATHCCKKCFKKPGQHGRKCAQRAHTGGAASAPSAPSPASPSRAEGAGPSQPRAAEVPQQEQQESPQEPALGQVVAPAQQCCAGCGFQVTGAHGTHCCKKCSKKPGQHGGKCMRRVYVQVMPPAVEPVVGVVAESDAERTLRQMGFEMTDLLRALLQKHDGDVPRTLEELM